MTQQICTDDYNDADDEVENLFGKFQRQVILTKSDFISLKTRIKFNKFLKKLADFDPKNHYNCQVGSDSYFDSLLLFWLGFKYYYLLLLLLF